MAVELLAEFFVTMAAELGGRAAMAKGTSVFDDKKLAELSDEQKQAVVEALVWTARFDGRVTDGEMQALIDRVGRLGEAKAAPGRPAHEWVSSCSGRVDKALTSPAATREFLEKIGSLVPKDLHPSLLRASARVANHNPPLKGGDLSKQWEPVHALASALDISEYDARRAIGRVTSGDL